MRQLKLFVSILALICSFNTAARNKVVVVPLVENAPPSNTIYVKSSGNNIGVLIHAAYDSNGFAVAQVKYDAYSSKGYFFELRDDTGLLQTIELHFTSSNCTGMAYHMVNNFGGPPPFSRSTGRVYSASSGQAYYEETGATTVMITANSSLSSGGSCASTSSQILAYPLLINDPAVTGVQNSYALPITTGF